MVTKLQLEQKHREICDTAKRLALLRGDQYANDEDELKTFKQVAVLESRPASKVCQTLINVKTCRLNNQMAGNEDISDTVVDLINYNIYLQILQEQEKVEASKEPVTVEFKLNDRETNAILETMNLKDKEFY